MSRFADCGITGDDAIHVSKAFHCVEAGTIDADLKRTVRLSWRELVQHLSLFPADGEAEVLGCITEAVDRRAFSVWARRAQSSANSSSVTSSAVVFVCARRRRRLNRLPFVRKRIQMSIGRSSFASRSMTLKKMENKMGARTHPCLTPLEIRKLPDSDPLLTMELAKDGEKIGGSAKARQDYPQSIAAEKGLGQVYERRIQTCVLFSSFLLYLFQCEDHV